MVNKICLYHTSLFAHEPYIELTHSFRYVSTVITMLSYYIT